MNRDNQLAESVAPETEGGGVTGAQAHRLPELLACPDCKAAPLSFGSESVSCDACGADYEISDGIIDFTRSRPSADTPRLYDNPYYKTFIENLSGIHSAHYQEGGAAAWIERQIKTSIRRLFVKEPAYIVDLGCGTGSGFEIYGGARIVIGVDASLPLLRSAKERFPEATLICADFAALPFRALSVEVFVANAVLEHVFHLETAVENAARCLSAHGSFYVVVPTEGGLLVDLARLVTSRRNAAILGLTPAQSRTAQRIDHCNTVHAVENTLWKHFEIEETVDWPFRTGGANVNLSRGFRLGHRKGDTPAAL